MKTPSPLPITDASRIHKVLVVDLNYMGDMLMSSPVIRELDIRLPARIDVLCYDFCAPIVKCNKYVDKVYTTKKRFPLWQAIKARFRGYDLVMQLNTSLLTNLLLLIAGNSLRLGYAYRWCGVPLSVRISHPFRTARSVNRIRENLNLLERAFGWKIDNEIMEINID